MTDTLYVVTHPEVTVQPDVPVPEWGLSATGSARAIALLDLPWVPGLRCVFSSAERKARQTAELLAAGRPVRVDAELGENDRTATGFLPPQEFEAVADAFFARPTVSVRGWETAADAQRRMLRATTRCLELAGQGDLAIVSHGAVSTLLWCALNGVPIDRRHDQPGQGSWYAVDRQTLTPASGWQRIPAGGIGADGGR